MRRAGFWQGEASERSGALCGSARVGLVRLGDNECERGDSRAELESDCNLAFSRTQFFER